MSEDLYARKEDKRAADSCMSMVFVAIVGITVIVAISLFGW